MASLEATSDKKAKLSEIMNATTALIGIGVARTVKPTVLFFILDLISAHENLRDMMPLNRPVFALNETMKSM